jgi:hypothetical protein
MEEMGSTASKYQSVEVSRRVLALDKTCFTTSFNLKPPSPQLGVVKGFSFGHLQPNLFMDGPSAL